MARPAAIRRRPKVLFVLPQHEPSFSGFEFMGPLCGFKTRNPPLGILTLAGAISPRYQVEIRDANVGPCAPTKDGVRMSVLPGLGVSCGD